MTTLEEKIAVMQHFARGGEIEIRGTNDTWYDMSTPEWDWAIYEYRIKREPLRAWFVATDDETLIHCAHEGAARKVATATGGRVLEMIELP
jgi:hypothetical protein